MRLKTKSIERWVKIGDEGAEVLLRPLSVSEATRIRDRHTRRKVKRGVEVERTDSKAMTQEVYQSVVRGWRGMLDEDGKDLPFSAETLISVIDSDPEFLGMIDEKLDELNEEIRRAGEANLGN